MTTALKLGPADHGRPMTPEEFEAADWQEGYRYELIEGRLYVVPAPGLPQISLEVWLYQKLDRYSSLHPDVFNFVTAKSRIPVPDRPEVTTPEPDLAAFRDFPFHVPVERRRWEDLTPVLVGEIVSEDDPDKDLVRNVELYELVPSIREYWILDPRPVASRPSLRVYRRRGRRWQKPIDVAFGETYVPRLMPDFALVVDPRR